MKKYLIIFLLLTYVVTTFADINVKSFRVLENDMDARVNYPLKDQNGDVCAIIKVVTTEKGFSFDSGIMGIVKTVEKPAEIWVYVPWGLRRLTIAHPHLGILRDYMLETNIEKATVYELVLVTGKLTTIVEKESIESQWLVISPNPKNASIYIDDVYINKGVYQNKLKAGTYTYRVEAPMYHTSVGLIRIADKKQELDISLKPNFGFIKVNSLPESNAQVLINDKPLSQHTPTISDTLKSGEYTVKIIKELYQPFAQKVMVKDEEITEINVVLQPNYGELTVYAPAEATIYLNNMSKGKGSWTGRLSSGVYSLEARIASHQTSKEDVEIKVGDNQIINLKPNPIYGSVDVITNPLGATIKINGKNYGTTPNTVKLLTGDYTLQLTKNGYSNIEKTINIKEGTNDEISLNLSSGKEIFIRSNPSNATVYFNNKKIGHTPLTTTLNSPQTDLKLTLKKYKTHKETISCNTTDFIYVDLKKSGSSRNRSSSYLRDHVFWGAQAGVSSGLSMNYDFDMDDMFVETTAGLYLNIKFLDWLRYQQEVNYNYDFSDSFLSSNQIFQIGTNLLNYYNYLECGVGYDFLSKNNLTGIVSYGIESPFDNAFLKNMRYLVRLYANLSNISDYRVEFMLGISF